MSNCTFVCDKKGENSLAKAKELEGLSVGGQVEIDGSTDLSNAIHFNGNGRVYGISLQSNSGFFAYVLNVDASGPRGFASGSGKVIVKDASGDEYSISITSSNRKFHTVKYNSKRPNIVEIRWESANGIEELSDAEIEE